MPHSDFDFVQAWQTRSTDRRALAKASALLGALAIFDFSTGEAQDGANEDLTRAVDWYASDDPDTVAAASDDGFVTIVADFPFTAVGASWNGEVGIWPLVEIQVSYDGSTFGDLIILPADVDTDRNERDDRVFSRLLFTNGESIIRFRTTDQNGKPVPVSGFGLTYIDASAGPSLDDLNIVTGADITTPPAIISRAGWGADESLRFSNGIEIFPRQYATVQHALVHHSDTPNADDPLQQMRSIYYFHAITRGWGDIGYNYLVDKFGNVYEGRVGGQNVIGNHSLAYNVGAAGVCLIGNHQVAAPTNNEIGGLVGLLAWVCRDLDPLGYSDSWDLLGLATIASHRDATGVECPGDYAYDLLPSIRTAVANTIANSPPASPAGGFVVGDLVAIDTQDGIPVNLRAAPGTASQIVTQLSDGILASITGNPALADGINWYAIATASGNGWIDPQYLELQPPPLVANAKFATWDVISANRSTVVLLDVPVSSAAVSATISAGTEMRVHAGPRFRSGKIWYHLYPGSDATDAGGWGNQDDFVLAAQPPAQTIPVVGDAIITTDSVNFRALPTLSGSIIRLLPKGTEGTVLDGPRSANAYNWLQLQTPYGQGWTVVDYLRASGPAIPSPTPLPGKFQPGNTVTNPNSLNLRAQPTTNSSVLALMSAGTIGTILAGPTSANGYSWYQIDTSYGTGWAAGELLNLTTNIPTPNPSPTPTPNPQPTPPPSGGFPIGATVKTTSALNLRSIGSTSGNVLAVLPLGATATVLGGPANANGYVWYQVQSNFGNGWVAGMYLASTTPAGGIQIGSTVRTTTGLRLRNTPSSSGAILVTMPTGTQGTVLAGPTSANGYAWWQLQTNLGTGWAAGAYLSVRP